jgi:hypothetical protein
MILLSTVDVFSVRWRWKDYHILWHGSFGEETDTDYFKILTWHSEGTGELRGNSLYTGTNKMYTSCVCVNESATIFQHIKLIPHSSAASNCYRWMEDFCTHKARWRLHAMNLEHAALECHCNRTKYHFTNDCHIWVGSHILQQIVHYQRSPITWKLYPLPPLYTKICS